MFDWLVSWDWAMFVAINSLPHTPFLDNLGLLFSFLGAFGLVWYAKTALIFFTEKKKDFAFVKSMILAGMLSLFFVSVLFKPLFHRDRPDVTLGNLAKVITTRIFLETLNDTYSYPSGHTTIAYAAAIVLARKRPKQAVWFYVLALIIALTRIYLGKHYPLDVLAGAILGSGIGWLSLSVMMPSWGRHKKGSQ